MSDRTSAAGDRFPSRWRLWGAVIAPPSAWAVQELVSAAASVEACERGDGGLARALLLGLSAAAFVVAAGSAFAARESFDRIGTAFAIEDSEARGPDEMLAVAGVALGAVFALALIWSGMPLLFLSDVCGAGR
jgi:hypothetical protein